MEDVSIGLHQQKKKKIQAKTSLKPYWLLINSMPPDMSAGVWTRVPGNNDPQGSDSPSSMSILLPACPFPFQHVISPSNKSVFLPACLFSFHHVDSSSMLFLLSAACQFSFKQHVASSSSSMSILLPAACWFSFRWQHVSFPCSMYVHSPSSLSILLACPFS